jgi:hypothetical protein
VRLERHLALVWACASALACVPTEEECFRQSRDVEREETVRGYVVGDLLAPYFARHEGTLSWQSGGTTSFSLELQPQPDNPYTLYEVYECDPRLVSHGSSARVVSADGSFDNEIPTVVVAPFPYSSLVPDSVANFSTFPEEAWNDSMREHLSFDPSRYVESGLQLVLDWAPRAAAPTGGYLDFLGATERTPPLVDTIRVGDLVF